MTMTLAIDCGGLFIKGSVLDNQGTMHANPITLETPYPLSPQRLIDVISEIADQSPPFDRLTVGLPGMIRHGVVVHTPHYINVKGPHTRIEPELQTLWTGLDFKQLVSDHFAKPALVLNDAEVHGAGIINGSGLEVVITLGTGLGFAVYDGGKLSPHFEMSRVPVRRGIDYDQWIGDHVRRTMGDALWSRRVRLMIESLRPVFFWDRVYIGGGNSRRIRGSELLGDDVVIVPNTAGIQGGVRAWTLFS
jgi:polyphosphate glucokinase